MEAQVFYWTGCILWWIVCFVTIITGALFIVYLPLKTFNFVYKKLWTWIALSKIVETGFNEEDLRLAATVKPPGGVTTNNMLKWFDEVKNRANIAKKRRNSGEGGY